MSSSNWPIILQISTAVDEKVDVCGDFLFGGGGAVNFF